MVSKEALFWDGLVKVLKLSEHGKMKLQVFPVRIVNSAYKKLQHQIDSKNPNKVHDKVKWLIRECDNQCKNDGISPTWGKYYDNLRSFGIEQTDSLIQEEQTELLDFVKPQVKPVEIYSTRDLTPHKKQIKVETLNKGLSFLGDFLPPEVQDHIKNYISEKSSQEFDSVL